eukprot:4933703-Amphidinium_carterae.1
MIEVAQWLSPNSNAKYKRLRDLQYVRLPAMFTWCPAHHGPRLLRCKLQETALVVYTVLKSLWGT